MCRSLALAFLTSATVAVAATAWQAASPTLLAAQAAALSAAQSAVQDTVGQTPLSLDAAVERALSSNPSIAAARLRRAVASREVDVARERPNPEARVEFEREAPHRTYALAIPIETGGKRARRIAVGEAAISVSEAEAVQVVAEVRSSVRRAYFARLIAESRLTLLEELQALALRARDAAQQRFDAGSAPRLEVLQAELQRSDIELQVTASRGEIVAARAALNSLLALPLDAATPLATPLDAAAPVTAGAAVARARSASADLAWLDRRLDEQRARIALAVAMRQPDLTSEAAVTRGQPEFGTGWRAAVSVAVPIFTRHRAGVLLEEATLAQLTSERDALLARLAGEVTAAAVVADARHQQYLRYRDAVIPQASEVERVAEDSYKLGQTGITSYLQALQATRDVRLRSMQAAADFHSALADLERAIGAPLP